MSQVFVKLEDRDGVNTVVMVHYQPQELDEAYLVTGMLVNEEDILQPDMSKVEQGFSATLAYNTAAGSFYYLYTPRQPTDQERIKQLEDTSKAQADVINMLLGL